mmetsp:Transcript_86503/g.259529  ORF Transcript_86503/g.259529 Transcript_86503/m.259529 type:complete len:386 (+) Transcript_86503:1445-2602(+)
MSRNRSSTEIEVKPANGGVRYDAASSLNSSSSAPSCRRYAMSGAGPLPAATRTEPLRATAIPATAAAELSPNLRDASTGTADASRVNGAVRSSPRTASRSHSWRTEGPLRVEETSFVPLSKKTTDVIGPAAITSTRGATSAATADAPGPGLRVDAIVIALFMQPAAISESSGEMAIEMTVSFSSSVPFEIPCHDSSPAAFDSEEDAAAGADDVWCLRIATFDMLAAMLHTEIFLRPVAPPDLPAVVDDNRDDAAFAWLAAHGNEDAASSDEDAASSRCASFRSCAASHVRCDSMAFGAAAAGIAGAVAHIVPFAFSFVGLVELVSAAGSSVSDGPFSLGGCASAKIEPTCTCCSSGSALSGVAEGVSACWLANSTVWTTAALMPP